jgi:DNA-binding CsgD family transcriptional regulator
VDELWRFDHRYNSPNFAAVTLFIYGVFILSCFFLFLWAFRKAGTYKSRRQGRIIIQVFVVITIVSSIETLLIPQVSAYRSLGIFPLMFFFLVIALGYAVVRYQFPGVTLAYVSREIMCNVEELVFLFDHYLQLETINDSALACMETSFERLRKRELKTLFYGGEELSPAIEKLRSSEESSCSCHITLRNFGAHESILVDARVSIVRDKYGDEIGVLVIGKRIKRARDLALDYGLTRRELDVLQGIVNGKSTREISNTLYISERTTKTHLTHIFAKLAVKNRVQLICNVMDYNLIPESSSEKRVLLHLIDEVPPD